MFDETIQDNIALYHEYSEQEWNRVLKMSDVGGKKSLAFSAMIW